MSDQPLPADAGDLNVQQVEALRARLLAGAERLRGLDHLEPADQLAVAKIVRDLADLLDPNTDSSESETHLAEHSAALLQAIETRHDTGLIASARDRLEEAAARAEAAAPVATGVVRQLIDALAGIGV